MQGDSIVEKILLDGKERAKQILQDAKEKANANKMKTLEVLHAKKREDNERLQENKRQLLSLYKTKTSLGVTRELLAVKQQVMADFKNYVCKILENMPKKDAKTFVQNMLETRAKAGDQVYVKINSLDLKDVEGMPVVKKLGLTVKAGERDGIILSNSLYDDDLTFATLAEQSINKNYDQIVSKFF